MAAAQSNNVLPLPQIDEYCKYTFHRTRQEGKVPCLGFGINTPHQLRDAEVTGLCFQKADTGTVKAALPADSFIPVTWKDAPTKDPPAPSPDPGGLHVRNLNNRLELAHVQANNVKPRWQEFTNAMRLVKNSMLAKMQIPACSRRPPPQIKYLYDGFHRDRWEGAPGNQSSLITPSQKLRQIKSEIGAAANWNETIEEWMQSLCQGFSNTQVPFKALFQYLLPNWHNPFQEHILKVVPCANIDGGIEDGVVRCLYYGHLEEQVRRGRRRNRNFEHRFLLTKRFGDNSRSRSRSPLSSDDEENLMNNVYEPIPPSEPRELFPDMQPDPVLMDDLLDAPGRYILKPNKHNAYFESHKPDLVLIKGREVPDTDYHGFMRQEYVVKVVVEISSFQKYSSGIEKLIRKNVEQCVQSCLGAFGCNQDLMYGLVLVVDGFVLIKLQKQNLGGQEELQITETDLLMWDNADDLHALFRTLEDII